MKRKLQVFISSTFMDLIEERQAAVSAVLKAGHIPAGMELFTAGDKSQLQTIEKWIDESDVYMLILGGRYGSIEKASGISYTELEYDYAIQQGKPVFAVVIKDNALELKVKALGTDFMEKANPKELALFRTKVLNNISSFFEDHKDIRLCVHESLADFATNSTLKGWVSGDEVVDTKPLIAEINKLKEENQILKEKIEKSTKVNTATNNLSQDTKINPFLELENILRGIDIKLPEDEKVKEGDSLDLLNLFYANRDALINGVTNRINSSKAEQFFYHNLCPKLQVHGLVINEKVAGVQYRRSYVSKLGNEFLAYIDKQVVLNNKHGSAEVKEKAVSSNSKADKGQAKKSKGET